eukprot:scaffold442_cov268-Pinguiococcus_pyrenoidosus.AAC.76
MTSSIAASSGQSSKYMHALITGSGICIDDGKAPSSMELDENDMARRRRPPSSLPEPLLERSTRYPT